MPAQPEWGMLGYVLVGRPRVAYQVIRNVLGLFDLVAAPIDDDERLVAVREGFREENLPGTRCQYANMVND